MNQYPIETRYYKHQPYHDEYFADGRVKRCHIKHGVSQWKKHLKVVAVLAFWTAILVVATYFAINPNPNVYGY